MTEHAKVSVVLTADFFIPNTQTELDAFSEVSTPLGINTRALFATPAWR